MTQERWGSDLSLSWLGADDLSFSIWVSHSASYVTSSALATVRATVEKENVRVGLVKRYLVIYSFFNWYFQYTDIHIQCQCQCWLQNQMFFINQNALIDTNTRLNHFNEDWVWIYFLKLLLISYSFESKRAMFELYHPNP